MCAISGRVTSSLNCLVSYINITNDNINEAEQVLLLEIEVESILDNSNNITVTEEIFP